MAWESARGVEVEPSLYGADFARLGEQVESLLAAGCRVFHFDVGDGHFVEPITMGPIVLASISPLIRRAGGFVDVHLMVDRPAAHFEAVAAAGGASVTFHYEAVEDVPATLDDARQHGLDAGVAFDPESEPEAVAAVARGADLVLCMAIHPGYSGQPLRDETFERVRRLRTALPRTRIQVDGGVGAANAPELRRCGADLFVAATAVFGEPEPQAAYRRLVAALR